MLLTLMEFAVHTGIHSICQAITYQHYSRDHNGCLMVDRDLSSRGLPSLPESAACLLVSPSLYMQEKHEKVLHTTAGEMKCSPFSFSLAFRKVFFVEEETLTCFTFIQYSFTFSLFHLYIVSPLYSTHLLYSVLQS